MVKMEIFITNEEVAVQATLIVLSGILVPFYVQAQDKASQPGFLIQMVPFALMFMVFYFLVMRPQARKQKDHQEFVTALKKGDRVLTNSGIFGTVEGLNEKYVILEIADGVRIRLLKTFVSQPISEGKA